MKKLTVLILMSILLAAPAWASTLVRLNGNVLASGSSITLGDLFSGLPENMQSIAVDAAPQLGEKKILNVQTIGKIMRQNDLLLESPTNINFIYIERASVSVSDEEISKAIGQSLAAQNGSAPAAIKLNKTGKSLLAAPGDDYKVLVNRLDYSKQTGQFTAELRLSTDPRQSLAVSGRSANLVKVPVLNVQRNTGEIIEESDISMVEMEESALDARAVTSAKDLIGKKAGRLITAQSVIRDNMISAPTAVHKNTLIAIVYQSDAITITGQVKALEDGAIGETIRVFNAQSKRTLDAVVSGPDQVQIATPRSKSVAMQ